MHGLANVILQQAHCYRLRIHSSLKSMRRARYISLAEPNTYLRGKAGLLQNKSQRTKQMLVIGSWIEWVSSKLVVPLRRILVKIPRRLAYLQPPLRHLRSESRLRCWIYWLLMRTRWASRLTQSLFLRLPQPVLSPNLASTSSHLS